MRKIEDNAALEALYPGTVSAPSTVKVVDHLTPLYRRWIEEARFCIVSTVGPGGIDSSPRGDDGPVVRALDETTLALPDWRGNNRLDSLRNIVEDGRVSLLFMVPGAREVVRANGRAVLTDDAALCASFDHGGKTPRTVMMVRIDEIYAQCGRAVIRSQLWGDVAPPVGLPSFGDILKEVSFGAIDGARFDADWAARAPKTLWSEEG